MSTKPERITELDVIRGIAAVWVMIFHFVVRYYDQPGPSKSPFDEYAVHLFFMISGFVIFMALRNTKTGTDFLVSRASRLYPAYWAAVLITAVFMVFIPPFEKSGVTAAQVAVNLTMLQQWARVREIDDVYWTLAIELAFYGWMFLIFKLRKLDRIERIGAVWMLIQIVARGWERTHSTLLDPNIIPDIISRTLILEHAHLFVAGMIFCRIRMEGPRPARAALLGGCLFTHYFINGPLAAPFMGLFLGVFLLIAKSKLTWLAFRPLVFLGSISYPLYLVHHNIGYAVMRKLETQVQGVQICAAVAVSLALAIMLSYLVEKPGIRFIRARYAAWKSLRGCEKKSKCW